ncbi:porin family protein [Cesiribacter andamanensis]|uniref:Outer membrane protein beta-barrel domain-containing protein n=1 Tax=Cesiribacter andamanensis AMV16 TaxID=1279009 RepID=M7N8A4_9BACT|nr:porin family protein [Cesiribacter andamanensis]EMR04813.1 hypothetical protein ADICEAN_00084 [Cesiribacter andamanensis AMV16]
MKRFLVLIPIFFAPFVAFSQVGIKAGSNLGLAQVEDPALDWENDGIALGLHAGLFTRINLGKVYLQPELYYTFSQAQLRNSGLDMQKLDLEFHRLDLPVLLGAQLHKHFRVNAGPFASVNLRTRSADSDKTFNEEINDYYSRTQWGWQAGIGFDFGRFSLDSRYETTIGNLREFDFENSSLSDYLPDDQKQRQFVVSLGYRFGNVKK